MLCRKMASGWSLIYKEVKKSFMIAVRPQSCICRFGYANKNAFSVRSEEEESCPENVFVFLHRLLELRPTLTSTFHQCSGSSDGHRGVWLLWNARRVFPFSAGRLEAGDPGDVRPAEDQREGRDAVPYGADPQDGLSSHLSSCFFSLRSCARGRRSWPEPHCSRSVKSRRWKSESRNWPRGRSTSWSENSTSSSTSCARRNLTWWEDKGSSDATAWNWRMPTGSVYLQVTTTLVSSCRKSIWENNFNSIQSNTFIIYLAIFFT